MIQEKNGVFIRGENIVKVFGKDSTEVIALNGINITIEKGSFTAIKGPSGCGKSTLLNILGCLEKPTSGKLEIREKDVTQLKDDDLAVIRRDTIGFIFQSYNLIPTMNALENVMLPMMFARKNQEETIDRANTLLKLVGMEKRKMHKPSELSGGEQQRVAVARALINDPMLIIGDEPTGNLDTKTGDGVMELFLSLNKEGRSILLVTHDSKIAEMAQKTIYIQDGKEI